MCTKCATPTPVGYRCKECIKGQRKVYFNAKSYDPFLQFGLAFVLSMIAIGVLSIFQFGFFFLIILFFAGSAIGGGIANLAHRVVSKRRGEYAYIIVTAGIVAGALALTSLGAVFPVPRPGILALGIYVFSASSGAIGYLRFGR
jgi:hypothetical protein